MAYLKLMFDEREIAHLSEMDSISAPMRACYSTTCL